MDSTFRLVDCPDEECPICFIEYEPRKPLVYSGHQAIKTPCGHVFGSTCLHDWLKESADWMGMSTCPTCRKPTASREVLEDAIFDLFEDFVLPQVPDRLYRKLRTAVAHDVGKFSKGLITLESEVYGAGFFWALQQMELMGHESASRMGYNIDSIMGFNEVVNLNELQWMLPRLSIE